MAAAGLGRFGASAAAAAHELGGLAGDVAGVEAAIHQVGRDHGHDHGGAVDDRAQGHHHAVELLLEVVAHLAHGLDVVGGGNGGDELDAVHVAHAAQQGLGFGAEADALGFGEAAAQGIGVGHVGVEAGLQLVDGGLELLGDGLQGGRLLHHQFLGGAAGYGLDATHPAADAGLAQHDQRTDLAGGMDVGAAADLEAEGVGVVVAVGIGVRAGAGHADDADHVAVAVAEEGQRALAHRVGVGGLVGGDSQVLADLAVGEALHR